MRGHVERRVVALTAQGRSAVVAARRARDAIDSKVADAVGRARVDAATAVLRDVLSALGATPEVSSRRVRRPR